METQGLRAEGLLSVATINPLDLSGLARCTEEARLAALDADPGPAEPASFSSLLARLHALKGNLPPLYRDTFLLPFIELLEQLGEAEYIRILMEDPDRVSSAGLVLDAAQALLQQGEGFAESATDAFQEVVSDLYDGFLSAEDRRGVAPPEGGTIPPLVKWGTPEYVARRRHVEPRRQRGYRQPAASSRSGWSARLGGARA